MKWNAPSTWKTAPFVENMWYERVILLSFAVSFYMAFHLFPCTCPSLGEVKACPKVSSYKLMVVNPRNFYLFLTPLFIFVVSWCLASNITRIISCVIFPPRFNSSSTRSSSSLRLPFTKTEVTERFSNTFIRSFKWFLYFCHFSYIVLHAQSV